MGALGWYLVHDVGALRNGLTALKSRRQSSLGPCSQGEASTGSAGTLALGPKPSALWGTVYCIRGLQVCGLVQQPEWTPGEQPNTVQGAAGILPLRTGALKAAAWGLATL